jgi:hypothetical protein
MSIQQRNVIMKRDFCSNFLIFFCFAYMGLSIWYFYEVLKYMYDDNIITEIYVFCALSAFVNFFNSLGSFVIFINPSSTYKPECILNTVFNVVMFLWNNVLLFKVIGISNYLANSLNTIVFIQYIFNSLFMINLLISLLKLIVRHFTKVSAVNTYEMLLSETL